MKVFVLTSLALVVASAHVPAVAQTLVAAATPIPGGSNQAKALEGGLGKWLFNGHYRLKMISVGDATPAELTAGDMTSDNGNGKKVLMLHFDMKLGGTFCDDVVAITLTDGDDNSVSLPSSYINPNPTPTVTQGAGWHCKAYAVVPADFKVAKIVMTFPTDPHHGGFRIPVK